MRRYELTHRAIDALTYLLELASREAGYLVHGVRGWATARDIETGVSTWSASELIAGQAACGRVTRVDVRAPSDARPVWVYRIAQKGIDALADAVCTAPAGIDPPRGDPGAAVYIGSGAWVAISALRGATNNPPQREKTWVEGQSGWRSSLELTRLVEQEDEAAGLSLGRTFFSEDLAWLARVGYAERQVVGRTHIYRLTPMGAAAVRLEWKEPGNA